MDHIRKTDETSRTAVPKQEPKMPEHDLPPVDRTIAKQLIAFVLDTSSLSEERIAALNEGLERFRDEMEELVEEYTALEGLEIAVVSFGGSVTVEREFTPIENWTPPTLTTGSGSPMGAAIMETCRMIEDRKEAYRASGTAYHMPEVWLVTGSTPTDMTEGDETWDRVTRTLERGVSDDHILFVPAGISGTGLEECARLFPETGLPLFELEDRERMFRDYFELVAESPQRDYIYTSPTQGIAFVQLIEDSVALSVVD
ncbi:hypothetical protein [Haloplanus salilacus]|uniref:vWA domain-containing protein n=1 Tax=Haloplanus salilacus TaxID=2949994 RepID=UPI0030CC614C